jgi:alanine racemase
MDALPRRRALDHLIRPTRAEIDLRALASNLEVARRIAAPAQVMAVIKANAYGHGAVLIARALQEAGVDLLAVALVEEGIELRNAGITVPIVVMGGSYEGGYAELVEHRLTPVVFRLEHLEQLSRIAAELDTRVAVHLKVDTGMARLGVQLDELDSFLASARRFGRIEIDGFASHFATADSPSAPLTLEQVRRTERALAQVRAHGHSPRFRHVSNTAGVLTVPDAHQGLFNLVRPGLMLFGLSPVGERADLAPVLSWKTGVIHVKKVPKGTPVSYGSTWVAERESVIATLPVGYADGYDRAYSSRAEVLVRGQRAKIAGRVCMDMVMIDVTDIAGVQVGDEVVLLGAQGGARIGCEELARLSETIPYEILCGIGARVPRVGV